MTNTEFKREGDEFFRASDGKKVAGIVGGNLKLSAPAFGKYREELEALLPVAPVVEDLSSQSPDNDATPRGLFSKTLGDVTPEVIEWRRENWAVDRFEEVYSGRLKS
jgi:hypothetical protein